LALFRNGLGWRFDLRCCAAQVSRGMVWMSTAGIQGRWTAGKAGTISVVNLERLCGQ
jgi:hypothetical protein